MSDATAPDYTTFIGLRDDLQRMRTDYDGALGEFSWPTLTDFNWAIDYFDHIAEGNDSPVARASLTYSIPPER